MNAIRLNNYNRMTIGELINVKTNMYPLMALLFGGMTIPLDGQLGGLMTAFGALVFIIVSAWVKYREDKRRQSIHIEKLKMMDAIRNKKVEVSDEMFEKIFDFK